MNRFMKSYKSIAKKPYVVFVVPVLLLVVGLGGGLAVASIQSNATASKNQCQDGCINVTSEGISPDSISLAVGSTVRFVAADDEVHNLGLGGGADAGHENHGAIVSPVATFAIATLAHAGETHDEPEATTNSHDEVEDHEHIGKYVSGDFSKGQAWEVTFNEEGTYKFHDHYNPTATILVVVYEPGKQYKLE